MLHLPICFCFLYHEFLTFESFIAISFFIFLLSFIYYVISFSISIFSFDLSFFSFQVMRWNHFLSLSCSLTLGSSLLCFALFGSIWFCLALFGSFLICSLVFSHQFDLFFSVFSPVLICSLVFSVCSLQMPYLLRSCHYCGAITS